MNVKISELVVEDFTEYSHLPIERTIGYRISMLNLSFDFGTDLLDYVYKNYLSSGVKLMFDSSPIVMKLKGDTYVSPFDISTEIESQQDCDIKLSSVLQKRDFTSENIDNLVVYRYLVCKKRLTDIDVIVGKVTELKVNSRLVTSWARCARSTYKQNGRYFFKIEVSEKLLISTEDYKGIDNTMTHELLHTCNGAFNHSSTWKSIAQYVCNYYDYNISVLSSASDVGSDVNCLLEQGYYACQCESCGSVLVRKSECKFILHPEWYACTCGGSFKRIQ